MLLCFPAQNDVMAKLEDMEMKLNLFLVEAEHMQYMVLLSVAANVEREIFNS